ncbi:MAG: hypothetical protein H6728_16890 [Myxococcales bacterium]|nr:hypothetical protein [Myxococcales bacterium]MCB9644750.1 hypothetical protein [Myxococcales bacterium]
MHPSPHEPVTTWHRVDILRAVGLGLLAFVLLGTYAIARPTSESLFLKEYTSKALPSVWLAVAFVALIVVALYNRYASWMPMLRLFGWVSLGSTLIVALLLWAQHLKIREATFALYVWKDVYVVVLVEIFWGYANQVFDLRKARWLYGLFCVMGSLGGLVANLGVGPLARSWGTTRAASLLVPLLFVMGLAVWGFEKLVGAEIPASARKEKPAWGDGVRIVLQSPYLWLVFLLILCAQIATNSMDYQYNRMLEQTYPQTDQRTAIVGQVYAVIDVVAIVFQFLTGPILRWFGVSATLLLIPATLLLALGAYLMTPTFGMIAFAKIFDKSMGYSLFRAAKEILYLPLSHDEKTQGKAIVDVFSYRAAKGFASILLMLLVAWHWGHLLGGISLLLLVGWLLLTVEIVRRYRRLGQVSNAVDTAPSND